MLPSPCRWELASFADDVLMATCLKSMPICHFGKKKFFGKWKAVTYSFLNIRSVFSRRVQKIKLKRVTKSPLRVELYGKSLRKSRTRSNTGRSDNFWVWPVRPARDVLTLLHHYCTNLAPKQGCQLAEMVPGFVNWITGEKIKQAFLSLPSPLPFLSFPFYFPLFNCILLILQIFLFFLAGRGRRRRK